MTLIKSETHPDIPTLEEFKKEIEELRSKLSRGPTAGFGKAVARMGRLALDSETPGEVPYATLKERAINALKKANLEHAYTTIAPAGRAHGQVELLFGSHEALQDASFQMRASYQELEPSNGLIWINPKRPRHLPTIYIHRAFEAIEHCSSKDPTLAAVLGTISKDMKMLSLNVTITEEEGPNKEMGLLTTLSGEFVWSSWALNHTDAHVRDLIERYARAA